MIRVNRPTGIPASLATDGHHATTALCTSFSSQPNDYMTGAAKFSFNNKIYGAEDVKLALRQAQHDKCCFCEASVTHVSFGDIEHFRPKAAVQETPLGPLIRPGYYWLAYEWTNLLFCCELCNRRAKGNYFPLRYNSRRARSHADPVEQETPLFINPNDEDPAAHLIFHGANIHSRTKRGDATWQALHLNRTELYERRLDHLRTIELFLEGHREYAREIRVAQREGRKPSQQVIRSTRRLQDQLAERQQDTSEYAAMVRDYLRRHRYQPVSDV